MSVVEKRGKEKKKGSQRGKGGSEEIGGEGREEKSSTDGGGTECRERYSVRRRGKRKGLGAGGKQRPGS